MADPKNFEDGRRWNRWRIAAWGGAACLLLVPLVAMQLTDEVQWTGFDFAFAAVLVVGTGLAFELLARKSRSSSYRVAVGVALAAAFVLIWANGAVGIIGDENNQANLMYAGVLAVGTLGALVARFRPQGMARALFATAFAQVLVPAVAWLVEWVPEGSELEVVAVNSFFLALFLGSAMLFRKAAEEQADASFV